MYLIDAVNQQITYICNKCKFVYKDITQNGDSVWNNINKYMSMSYQYLFHLVEKKFFDKNLKKCDRKHYKLEYFINNKKYIYIVNPVRGPSPIKRVENQDMVDITQEFLSYMGPRYDFMNMKYTPKFFEMKKVIFTLQDGNKVIFDENEYIEIPQETIFK